MRQRLLFLSLFTLTVSGCVTVPNTSDCSVAGSLRAGGFCAEEQTSNSIDLNEDEFLDFLEAQDARDCVPYPSTSICRYVNGAQMNPDETHPLVHLPKRGAAVCKSTEDFQRELTALKSACRELGSRCNYEIQQAIISMERFL